MQMTFHIFCIFDVQMIPAPLMSLSNAFQTLSVECHQNFHKLGKIKSEVVYSGPKTPSTRFKSILLTFASINIRSEPVWSATLKWCVWAAVGATVFFFFFLRISKNKSSNLSQTALTNYTATEWRFAIIHPNAVFALHSYLFLWL